MDGASISEQAGSGLTILVNPTAGPAFRRPPKEILQERLPGARLVELDAEDDLVEELRKAAGAGATALGMAGGDGSMNAAAEVALTHDLPLLVIPAGTLNHLARDLGLDDVESAAEAFLNGATCRMDVAMIDGRPFLNTASLGDYVELVDRRERLEGRIGKWPAFAVAFFSLLFRSEPVTVTVDGAERRLWVAFFGNCAYQPRGIAPRARRRLDDGQMDVRMLDARRGWARLRLLAAGLVGRAHLSRDLEQRRAPRVEVQSSRPVRLARDGEVFDGSRAFEICKSSKALVVFVPEKGD